jgi:hypothetical protein
MAKSVKGFLKASLVPLMKEIKKEWWKELRVIGIADIIIATIKRGITPVAGYVARFQKYSQSYINQIKGKEAFFFKNGKLIHIDPYSSKEMKAMEATKGEKKSNKASADFVKEISKKKFGNKKQSPVSMHLTGKMLGSLSYRSRSGTLIMTDPKFKYHNDGEGKLPERRLLPNREGESFNRLIQKKITDALNVATGKKTKGLIKITFKFK